MSTTQIPAQPLRIETPDGVAEWRALEWDTEQFGMAAARLDLLEASGPYAEARAGKQKLLSSVMDRCREAGIRHLSARVDTGNFTTIHALEDGGFELIDGIQTFLLPVNGNHTAMPSGTRACASIRVVTPGFRNDLIGKGVATEKVHYVPNFVDTEFYAPRANENSKERGTRFRVIYAGNIGSSQGLGVVLDAAEILRDEAAVEFVLAGDGVDLPALKLAAADHRLENVKFLGRLAPSEMPLLYSTADALLVHLRDEPIHRITIPHKTLAYLAAGKPVIAAVRGDVAEVVRAAEAGIACEPDCGMALAEAVKQLAAMPERARLKLGRNARAVACREYSRVAVVRKLEGLCRKAVETPGAFPAARRSEA